MRAVLVDGVAVSPREATVPIDDRAFLYGDSVFETLRAYGGTAFALDAHLERLASSAACVRMETAVDPGTLADEVRRALAATGLSDAYVRVTLTRGRGALSAELAACVDPRRFVVVDELRLPARATYRDGVAASVVHAQRATDGPWGAGAKVGNYLVNLLSLDDARRRGASEALFATSDGRVREAASANFAVVSAGAIVTAPASDGILAGITRGHLVALARSMGFPVHERAPSLDEVCGADEAFTCASVREVVPVTRVGAAQIGRGVPGPITRALHAALREVAGARGPMPWEA